jgi:PAS domain S-box-containing protein
MQSLYKPSGVVLAFALLLSVLAANAFIMRRQLSVQIGAEAWVTHTRQVLFETEQTESLLRQAESAQRGFLYTGDPIYLPPYSRAAAQVEPHIDNLARLTADNPSQQERIARLRNLAHGKLSELARMISLYQSGKDYEARAEVVSHLGKSYMDDIRRVIAPMEQEETSLEAARTDAYRKTQRNTIASIYLASCLAAFGLVLLAYYIMREMRVREKHTQEMRAREEWFRVTLSGIGDAVIATDRHGIVTFLNPVAETLTGTSLEKAKGQTIEEVFPIFNEATHLPAEDPVKKVLEVGSVVGLANHTALMNADGTLIPIEDTAAPIRDDRGQLIGVVLVFRDATKERKAQEIVRKTEKLAAAARLAASVAHELNNPLEAVTNLIYLANRAPETPPTIAVHLTQAEAELKRVAHITQQTLGFYRESMMPEPTELRELIESVLAVYSNKFKSKNITVETDFGECPPMRGVAGELKHVVSNLISNAADAVGNDGTIAVKLRCIEGSESVIVQLVVEDDGPGIAAEFAERIFEPFFTTKKDVGTGLGLWVTKEIIQRHGGSIHLHPRGDGGRGAAFIILLPCASEVPRGVLEQAQRNKDALAEGLQLSGDPTAGRA